MQPLFRPEPRSATGRMYPASLRAWLTEARDLAGFPEGKAMPQPSGDLGNLGANVGGGALLLVASGADTCSQGAS